MNGAINERVGLLLVPRYNSGTKKQRNMREGLYIADKKSVFQYLEKRCVPLAAEYGAGCES